MRLGSDSEDKRRRTNNAPNITVVAALIGDHARTQVLTVLLAGKALTATELANAAGVTRQTISTHLAQLVDAHPVHTGPRTLALRRARVCYDHLAGELGVLVYDKLVQRGAFALGAGGMTLTAQGTALLAQLNVATLAAPGSRRPFCRACLDWSERRDHLAGALGAALLVRFEQLDWARRVPASRILAFSPTGEAALRAWLD